MHTNENNDINIKKRNISFLSFYSYFCSYHICSYHIFVLILSRLATIYTNDNNNIYIYIYKQGLLPYIQMIIITHIYRKRCVKNNDKNKKWRCVQVAGSSWSAYRLASHHKRPSSTKHSRVKGFEFVFSHVFFQGLDRVSKFVPLVQCIWVRAPSTMYMGTCPQYNVYGYVPLVQCIWVRAPSTMYMGTCP